jgi:hypothetical protein
MYKKKQHFIKLFTRDTTEFFHSFLYEGTGHILIIINFDVAQDL